MQVDYPLKTHKKIGLGGVTQIACE